MLNNKSEVGYQVKNDYLYGNEAEMSSFFRIPKALIEHPLYSGMSAEAKLLYGCFLDRASLSGVNDWKDRQGRIYIVFQFEDIKRILGCSNQKASKVLTELEIEYDLIDRKKQGFSKPNLIYVKKVLAEAIASDVKMYENQNSVCEENRVTEILKSEVESSKNQSFRNTKIEATELRKSYSNNTNINKTNINNTESTFTVSENDGRERRRKYEKYFEKNLSVKQLVEEYPTKKEILYEVFEVILDAMCSNSKTIRIAKDDKPRDIVHSQFMKLNANHIRYVLEVLENSSNIRNMKQYILTTLYNASMTINNYITSKNNGSCEKEEIKVLKDHFGYFGPETNNRELLNAILGNL